MVSHIANVSLTYKTQKILYVSTNERQIKCRSSTNLNLSTYDSMLVYCLKLSFFFFPLDSRGAY